jgi:hypothetical protein
MEIPEPGSLSKYWIKVRLRAKGYAICLLAFLPYRPIAFTKRHWHTIPRQKKSSPRVIGELEQQLLLFFESATITSFLSVADLP